MCVVLGASGAVSVSSLSEWTRVFVSSVSNWRRLSVSSVSDSVELLDSVEFGPPMAPFSLRRVDAEGSWSSDEAV